MGTPYLYIAIAAAVGIAAGLQAVINSQLNKSVDLFLTSLVVNLVASLTAVVLYVVFSRDSFAGLRQAEPWTFFGGMLGIVIIMGGAFLIPRIGVALASIVIIFSQLFFAMIADHYGLFGIQTQPVTWFKVGGLGLIVLGIILFFQKA